MTGRNARCKLEAKSDAVQFNAYVCCLLIADWNICLFVCLQSRLRRRWWWRESLHLQTVRFKVKLLRLVVELVDPLEELLIRVAREKLVQKHLRLLFASINQSKHIHIRNP